MNQRRAWMLCLSVVALALILYALGIPLASSQGPFLRSRFIASSLPRSPHAQQWEQASPLILALTGQVLTDPMLPDPSVKSLTVWSLHNDHEIAFLLEWLDSTQNTELTPGTFRDAAALAFPIGKTFAFSCMGRADSYLNIWHWKADWQADLDHAEAKKRERDRRWRDPIIPRRTSSVEELVTEGVDIMTSKRLQGHVQGDATWAEGRWRVIFRRSIETPSDSGSAELRPGQNQVVSFAVWDGEVKERGGQKAVGSWVRLIIDGAPHRSNSSEKDAGPSVSERGRDSQKGSQSCRIEPLPGVLTPVQRCQFDLLRRRCSEDDRCMLECMADGVPRIGGGCFHVCFFSKGMGAWYEPNGWDTCQDVGRD